MGMLSFSTVDGLWRMFRTWIDIIRNMKDICSNERMFRNVEGHLSVMWK